MKKVKRAAIWLVLMLVIFAAADAAGAVIVKKKAGDMLTRATSGYSKKGELMIHPVPREKTEESRANGLQGLVIRALLSDDRLDNQNSFWYNFLFLNMTVDQSVVFRDEDGTNELSEGVFALVYQKLGEKLDHMYNPVGVVDVRAFIKQDCAPEVFKILDRDDLMQIRLDSFSVKNYIVQPAAFTILDESGNEIKSFECPCDGELSELKDCYIYNDADRKSSGFNMYKKMKVAYLGERSTERAVRKLMDKADFVNSPQHETKWSYGPGMITSKSVETNDGYAQATVLRFCYYKGVVLYTVILGAVMTVVFLLICRKRDNRQDSFY